MLTVSDFEQGAQQIKDNGFDARFILVDPAGNPPADDSSRELFEAVIGPDLNRLESSIYGSSVASNGEPSTAAAVGDVEMKD